MPFQVHEVLMGLVEGLFLGQGDINIPVALTAVNLANDLESQSLIIFDIVEPVSQFGSVLIPNDLIKDFIGH